MATTSCDFKVCTHCGVTSCGVIKLDHVQACLSCHDELAHLADDRGTTYIAASQYWRNWRTEHGTDQFAALGHCTDHTQPHTQPG